MNPSQKTAIDVLKEVSVHYVALQIREGILGGPAFSRWTAVVQKGDTALTIGLCLIPKFSSAVNMSNEMLSNICKILFLDSNE